MNIFVQIYSATKLSPWLPLVAQSSVPIQTRLIQMEDQEVRGHPGDGCHAKAKAVMCDVPETCKHADVHAPACGLHITCYPVAGPTCTVRYPATRC